MQKQLWFWVLLVLVACGRAAEPPPAPAKMAQPYDVEAGVAAFDMSWERIAATYFNEDMDGIDWDAVRDELRPRAEAATSRSELRGVIRDMLEHLNKSHFEVMSGDVPTEDVPDDIGSGWCGIDIRSLDGELVVTRVEADGPAGQAGVKTGWILQKVDGQGVTAAGNEDRAHTHLNRHGIAKYFLRGEVGTVAELTLLDDAGEERVVDVTRTEDPSTVTRLPGLPPRPVEFDHRVVEHEGYRVGVIRFDLWSGPVVGAFRSAIRDLADTDGIILDLRGNIGGIGALSMGIAGYFLHEPGSLGVLRSRDSQLNFNVQPRPIDAASGSRANYDGPLALLMDIQSASTTEVFAAGIQELGRARIFGTVSAGMALPAMAERLPSGDILMHAIADFHTPLGKPLEGRGVIPDESVQMTREALLNGEDAVLSAALQWIQSETADDTKGNSR